MKRALKTTSAVVLLSLVLAGTWVWETAFRTPPVNLLPLPEGLIAADSQRGKELLANKGFLADYDALTKHFESQSRPAFSGVASSVIALNALEEPQRRPLSQSTFFTNSASAVVSSLDVTFGGMTLGQLGDFLRSHAATVMTHYASDTSLEVFRSITRQNLETQGDFLLVNYQRAELGQNTTGHISPVAAYDAATDRMLILDVAAYEYPPVWVSTEMLWTAMNTVDDASGRTRGFIEVRKTLKLPRLKPCPDRSYRYHCFPFVPPARHDAVAN